MALLDLAKEKFFELVSDYGLLEENLTISFRKLETKEAIGSPKREDLPIILGKEHILEASFKGVKAHVFTDSPGEYEGKIGDILNLERKTNRERAILIGAINSVLKYLGIIEKTIHCRDEEPTKCGLFIAENLKEMGVKKVGLIGLNPAILEGLVKFFGEDALRVTDLNPENIGKTKFGVKVWNGLEMNERMVKEVEFLLITGTTFVNGTADEIIELVRKYEKDYMIYGVTASGVAKLLGLPTICPYSKG